MNESIPRTEKTNPEWAALAEMRTADAVRLMLAEEAASVAAISKNADDIALLADLAGRALKAGGRVIYVGAGTSGRMGAMDAAECVPTFGTDPETVLGIIAGGSEAMTRAIEGAEDDGEGGRIAVDEISASERDVVIGISASGTAAFVRSAVKRAAEVGASTGWVTSSEEHPPVDAAIVLDTGPEVLAGSTRLKAATAAKIVLNTVSTLAMAAAGRVTGNRMTSMTPTNGKLRSRAVRILAETSEVGEEEAKKTLVKTGWNITRALEILSSGKTP